MPDQWYKLWSNHSCAEEICPTCQGKVRQLIEEHQVLQTEAARILISYDNLREENERLKATLAECHKLEDTSESERALLARLSAAEKAKEDAMIETDQVLLTIREGAALLRVSETTVYELVRTNQTFPSVKIGRRRLIPREALLTWIEEQR